MAALSYRNRPNYPFYDLDNCEKERVPRASHVEIIILNSGPRHFLLL